MNSLTAGVAVLADSRGKSASLDAIAGALIPAGVIAAAYFTAFLAVRTQYCSQYSARTYSHIIPEKNRTPSTSTSSTGWFRDYWRLDDTFVLRHHSFDAYLYLRFFRFIILICFVGCCLTWPILFPLNATGGGTAQQLDRLSYANVAQTSHLWGHAVVACVFFSVVILLINRERMFLIGLRQAYFTTSSHAQRLSSRTVLFLNVPKEADDDSNLSRLFGEKVRRSWKISKVGDLKKCVDERGSKVFDLELAELKLEKNVAKQQRKNGSRGNGNSSTLERGENNGADEPQNRPTHRNVPLVGAKLDTVDHILEAIPELNERISHLRERYDKNDRKKIAAIFVEFEDQSSAHQALQQVQHHSPLALQPRYIGIPPGNVNWQNLTIDPSIRISNTYIAIAIIIATTIFWSIPVGFVGSISNIQALADSVEWLHWYNKIPASLRGTIQGFVPPFALSFLTSYVPFWFRYVSQQSGAPTAQATQHFTQTWFFVFQFLQVFLVTTLSSGAATIVNRIADRPGSVPRLLADNLPRSANFYLTYFTLQGLGSAANDLVKTSDTFQYVFYGCLFDKTPRDKYERETQMKALFFGSKYPKFTNLTVIALAYACIAPLVLGFALAGFTLFYFTNRYLYLYANNVKLELKGSAHALALQHLYTGIYTAELCLVGLFGARDAKGPSIVMTVFLILTILHHLTVNQYLNPLEKNIPLDILREAAENGNSDQNDAEQDNDDSSAPLLSTTFPNRPRQKRDPTALPDPPFFLPTLSRILPPRLLPDLPTLIPYLTNPRKSGAPRYTDSQLEKAYMHPALKESAPLVWIPKDENGVSDLMKERNKERAGLETKDEGAWLNQRGELGWEKDRLSLCPVFKEPVAW